jgi:cyclopropane-fatty-acyl-phospholipid synthase
MTQVSDHDPSAGPAGRIAPDDRPRPEPASLGADAGAAGLARVVETLLGGDLPIAVVCYDGSRAGPADAPATLTVRSADALRRILTAPGELGLGRAYVAGDLDVEGDIYAALALRERFGSVRLSASQWLSLLRLAGAAGLRPLPAPPEEARLRGRRHSPARDAAAIAHHYNVSNAFYRLVLGPSMTYSCAVWPTTAATLEEAQAAKYELVCRKLGLSPGMRLLDVGCGWGGMVLHAARHHGVHAVGVTLSAHQAEWAGRAVTDAGLGDRVQIRLQDYRDVADGPYDAISSIGMFEHVGLARLGDYFVRLNLLLRPGGRLLNHGISRPPGGRPRFSPRGFIDRYVFPDGEVHEIGAVVTRLQAEGFEVRHVESLREHYARTLRAWVANLEQGWNDAVAEVGAARARIWRLYMAGCALNFEAGSAQVHQVLAVPANVGHSEALRPDWEATPLTVPASPT